MMVWVYWAGPNIEKNKKEVIKIFISFELSIAVTTNIISANLIQQQTLINLIENRMMNFFIPTKIPTTLTPNTVRQIQLLVSSRVSSISSNQSIFNSSIRIHKEAPTKNGFNDDIIYTSEIESINSERNKTRNIKIIWFNPLYSYNVETSIGKTFLKLVKKHFPRNYSFQQEHH